MIQRIFATLIIVTLYLFVAVQSTLQAGTEDVTLLNPTGQAAGKQLPRANVLPTREPTRNVSSDQKISIPASSSVARFDENVQSWTFPARVIQLKDVSIYGRPGTIAQIEFIREKESRYAWTVVQIDNYYFTGDIGRVRVDQEIILETAGPHVSSQGVNWDQCPTNDVYCRYARFIEGGFPTSKDYNGLTICPSNMLIYAGDGSPDWINGMLAWKIKVVD